MDSSLLRESTSAPLTHEIRPRRIGSRSSPGAKWKGGLLFIAALALGGLFAATKPSIRDRLLGNPSTDQLLTHTIERGPVQISVLASGVVESASTIDVLSEVEGQVAIISLLPRGTKVKQGDTVVELDSASLRTAWMQQRVVIQQAKAALAQAEEAQQITNSQAESELSAAELAVKFARMDLQKYMEGDYPQEKRIIESEIRLAEEELKRAQDRIGHTQGLKELGYVSKGQVDADRMTVMRYEIALKLAQEKMRLLDEFTYRRMADDHESRVAEATRAVARREALAESARAQADSKLEAQRNTLELEEAKLQHLADQIEKCTLRAPQDGVVLYPVAADEETSPVKEGAIVRQRQHVFTLPDTETMQVSASIHESSVHLVDPGKPVDIWIDAFPDQKFQGTTTSISSLPDLQSWRKSTVNFYPAKILIEGDVSGLRPGMNGKVEVRIEQFDDVLAAPVQSILRKHRKSYCVIRSAEGRLEARPVKLGSSNDELVVITEGVQEGQQVLLSPEEADVNIPEPVRRTKSSQGEDNSDDDDDEEEEEEEEEDDDDDDDDEKGNDREPDSVRSAT